MKNLLLILAFLSSFPLFISAQEVPAQVHEDSIDAFLNTHYKDGARGFLEMFYKNINYPKVARRNCTSGILIVKLTFGKNGSIAKTELFNPLGDGIEEEVVRVINISKGGWKSLAEGRSISFSLGFIMGEKEKLNCYITMIAVINGLNCYTIKDFQKKLNWALKKEKYEKALAYCDQILRRNPWSEEHIKIYEELVEKLGL